MLKRKREDNPTEEQSQQRKNSRRKGFLLKEGKKVTVYWAPSDIWAPAIIDKRVHTGIVIKWLSDGTTTLILDAFVNTVIKNFEPAPEPLATSGDSLNERLKMEQKKEAREKNKKAEKRTGAGTQNEKTCVPGAGIEKEEEEEEEEEDIHYQGVSKNGNGFSARIRIDCKNQCLGTFDTRKEAAIAWDRVAIQAGHPTSKLNFLGTCSLSWTHLCIQSC